MSNSTNPESPSPSRKPSDRIIFALDVDTAGKAGELVEKLQGHVGAFKVGLELFVSTGRHTTKAMVEMAPIMLDLKLHDIPETVERTILRMADLGVKFATLHVQQRETLERAAKMADLCKIQLLGVTVLTSMTGADMHDLDLGPFDPEKRALSLARYAWEAGITGFVCSPGRSRTSARFFRTPSW